MRILPHPDDGAERGPSPRERRRSGRGRGPVPPEPKRSLLEALVSSAAGTQEELASELGISYATLHAWKTGRRQVPDKALEDMARLALRRSRALTEAGARLLRLAGVEPPGEDGGVPVAALTGSEERA